MGTGGRRAVEKAYSKDDIGPAVVYFPAEKCGSLFPPCNLDGMSRMGPVGHPPAWSTPALLPPSYPHLSTIIKDPSWATAMALDFTPSVAWGHQTRLNRPLDVRTCSLEQCSPGQGGPRVEPRGDGWVDAGSQGRMVWAHEAAGERGTEL